MIYTDLRIGEVIALRWSDVDIEKRRLTVSKSVEKIINREYDGDDPERMKELGILHRINREGRTKTKKIRVVSLNSKAIDAITLHKKYAKYTEPDDYVVATPTGGWNDIRNMYNRLNVLLAHTNIAMGKCGLHMLRHTFASLLFAKDIPVEVIASILGDSVDTCRDTYIHFCQQREADAVQQIIEFDI